MNQSMSRPESLKIFPLALGLAAGLLAGTPALAQGADSSAAREPSMIDCVKVIDHVSHTLALDQQGHLWVKGSNELGQIGTGQPGQTKRWTKVMDNVLAIAGGTGHSLALKNNGDLWVSGNNVHGQLGGGASKYFGWTFAMSGVKDIAAGNQYSLVLKKDGTLLAGGLNNRGQLGDGTLEAKSEWSVTARGIKQIAAGRNFSMALSEKGTLYAAGTNNAGQLGTGTQEDSPKWTRVGSRIQKIVAGDDFSIALKDGDAYATGSHRFGQAGLPSNLESIGWVKTFSSVVDIDASGRESQLLDTAGTLFVAGQSSLRAIATEKTGMEHTGTSRWHEVGNLEELRNHPEKIVYRTPASKSSQESSPRHAMANVLGGFIQEFDLADRMR